jgi:hypothetical protein
MRVLLAATCLVAACGGPTSLVVGLKLDGRGEAPDTLQLKLFGAGSLGAYTLPVTHKPFPGTVLISPLDAATPDFRVLVNGLNEDGVVMSQAATRVALVAGLQTQVNLTLGAPLMDRDGDGVPDVIDDCSEISDPEQRCDGVPPDLGGAPPDLASAVDLASDLAVLGAPRCSDAFMLCEDFESGVVDALRWPTMLVAGNGTLTVDNTRAARGTHSLHLHSNALASGASVTQMLGHVESAQLPSPMYVRLFVYLGEPPPGSDVNYAAVRTTNDSDGIKLVTYTDNFGFDSWGAVSGMPSVTSSATMPVTSWACLEWKIVTGTPGAMSGSLGDQPLPSMQAVSWNVPPSFREVDIGVSLPGPATALDVWVDEVVIDKAPIGCAR